ncbi:hypothetical protein [Massilia genomosp. 1]|uniref:Uncharacterized protein n=1 Tax=Massilia genomosp. 1 TaxID=2609280 RepID=A0ABX0MWH2_9BURK|nr:hypothetical protein [Massilia genomosp. 1]NHZ67043.1 hypothetical protein [Massilia genomosp. 1]
MSAAQNPSRKIVRILLIAVAVIILMPGIFLAFIWYANVAAEKNARMFCEGIPIGSDISLEIAKFEEAIGYKKKPGGKVSVHHYGFPQKGFSKDRHTFLFDGFMFDKGYCEVTLNAAGKVMSKNSSMQYD